MINIIDIFQQKWLEVYLEMVNKGQSQKHTAFGVRQKTKVKKEGDYYLILNACIGDKRPSQWVMDALMNKCVYFPFDQKRFSFNKISQKQYIACVDFEQKQIAFGDNTGKHKLIINGAPLCFGHCLFIPYMEKLLPQNLTAQFIEMSILLKEMFSNNLICYNSQGAASSVNHFHLQLIDLEKVFSEGNVHFKIQEASDKTCSYTKTSEQLINITHFKRWGASWIKLSTKMLNIFDEKVKKTVVDIIEKLSEISFSIKVPYNLVIIDSHTTFFIFRNFATDAIPFGYLQYLGVIVAKTEKQFDNVSLSTIQDKFEQIKLDSEVESKIESELKSFLSTDQVK